MPMAKKIIQTNPHLRTRKQRIEKIARSASASARIEGIEIDIAEIRQMAARAVKKNPAKKSKR